MRHSAYNGDLWRFASVKGWAALTLCLCLVASPGVRAENGEPHAELLPNDIAGVVLGPDGETPIEDLPVRVWSVDRRRYLYRTKTDKDGMFDIPRMRTGRCYLLVGGVKIDLRILSRRAGSLMQHHDIVIALPRRMVVASRLETWIVPIALDAVGAWDILTAPELIRPPPPPIIVSP
jgi:hypothetical protein